MKKLNRSAKTGKIVTKEFAESHPATTVTETIKEVQCITQRFASDDLNVVVEKVNEIIASLK